MWVYMVAAFLLVAVVGVMSQTPTEYIQVATPEACRGVYVARAQTFDICDESKFAAQCVARTAGFVGRILGIDDNELFRTQLSLQQIFSSPACPQVLFGVIPAVKTDLFLRIGAELTRQGTQPAVGTREQCLTLNDDSPVNRSLVCATVQSYLGCLLQALGVDANTYTRTELQDRELRLDVLILFYLRNCTLNIPGIIDGLRSTTASPTTPTTTAPTPECLNGTIGSCKGIPNGDYAICFPCCKLGLFITCSNFYTYKRQCPLGFYGYYISELVFDPFTKRCELKSHQCPREEDALATY